MKIIVQNVGINLLELLKIVHVKKVILKTKIIVKNVIIYVKTV